MIDVIRGHWPWRVYKIFSNGKIYIIDCSVLMYKGKRVDYTGTGDRGILYSVFRRGAAGEKLYETNVVASRSFDRSIIGRWRNTIRKWENNENLEFKEESLDFRARKR